MTDTNQKIYIIGGGISGLIAAITLEAKGYTPTIIEATDRVGGRVKTDIVDGYQLDHGFQVLLDAYPKAKEYLDYPSLELQAFLPGATIYKNRKSQTIGDPTRSIKMLLPTMTSSIGTLGDKLKILKLNTELKKKSIEEIFDQKETTTLEYLKKRGFSQAIINEFFKPFFSGIFLETALDTSSRMFEFVYKMFGEGMATLPKAGIEAIPKQLKSKLNKTTFLFNTPVKSLASGEILLDNGDALESDYTIIATEASSFVLNLRDQDVAWKSCVNLYFETEKLQNTKAIIGLIADENTRINNIFYYDTIATKSKGSKSLLSVTVVDDDDLGEEALVTTVISELATYCAIKDAHFLKAYYIKKALPNIDHLRMDCEASETQLTDSIFLGGDHLLNGSLNAAMISGEKAAQAVIEKISGLMK